MSGKRFPKSPEVTPNPFDGGPNPFSDGNEQFGPLPAANNPYQAMSGPAIQPYNPVEYQRVLPNRSATVLRFGIFGSVFSGLSLLVGIVVVSTAEWTEGMIYCLPMGLVGFAFALPAWRLAAADLRAIRAGAMDEKGERSTRIGYWLGVIASLVGVMPTLGGIAAILYAMFSW